MNDRAKRAADNIKSYLDGLHGYSAESAKIAATIATEYADLEAEVERLRGYCEKRLEAVKQLTAENARLRESCLSLVKAANDAHDHWDAYRDAKVGKLLAAMGGSLKEYRAELDAAHDALKDTSQ